MMKSSEQQAAGSEQRAAQGSRGAGAQRRVGVEQRTAIVLGIVFLASTAASAASPVFSPARPATVTAPSMTVRAVPPAPAPAAERPSRGELLRRLAEIQRALQETKDNPAGGGGVLGPMGKTCAEAREHMRWSSMPCAPDMPKN